jgi:membrane protein DedA with SNARE-associated domain
MEDPGLVIEAIGFLGKLSYWGIFGLSLLANIFIPVPEEIFLLTLGYLTGGVNPPLNPYLTVAIVTPGLLISDMFLYTLARHGGRYVRILEKKIKNFKFTRDESFIKKHITKIVVISRFVVQFRFIGPVLAGTTRMPFKKFILWDFLALLVYVPFVIFIGNFFHSRIERVLEGIAVVKNYVLIGVGLIVLYSILKFIRNMFFKEFVVKFSETDGYIDTFIPGIKKKMYSDLEELDLEETSSE